MISASIQSKGLNTLKGLFKKKSKRRLCDKDHEVCALHSLKADLPSPYLGGN